MKFMPFPFAVGFCLLATGAFVDAAAADPASPTPAAPGLPATAPAPAQDSAKAPPIVFAARPPATPADIPAAASGAAVAAAQKLPAITMASYEVRNGKDRTADEVNAKLAQGPLLAPCAIFTDVLPSGTRVDALCAPLPALPGENEGGAHQARFPLLSFDW